MSIYGIKRYGLGWMAILFLWGALSGCSVQVDNKDNTGGVAISIKVVEDNSGTGEINYRSTIPRGISMDFQVRVAIFDAGGDEVATGGPWDWGEGHGTISDVPPGTDMWIMVSVFDGFGSTIHYRGSVYDVTVVAGETTDLTDSPVYVYAVSEPIGVCADFSGTWDMEMADDASACGEGYSEPYYETYFISQTGCNVEITIQDLPITLSGWVEDDIMYLDNKTVSMYGETTSSWNWEFEMIFDDMIEGYADWMWDDGFDSCTGYTDFYGTRSGL